MLTFLIQQLCEDQKAAEVDSKSPVRRKQTRPLDVCMADPERLAGQHFPDMYLRWAEDAGSDMRRPCKMCGKKVPVRCEQCDVPLCIEAPACGCYQLLGGIPHSTAVLSDNKKVKNCLQSGQWKPPNELVKYLHNLISSNSPLSRSSLYSYSL
jgi:hypothetical protein